MLGKYIQVVLMFSNFSNIPMIELSTTSFAAGLYKLTGKNRREFFVSHHCHSYSSGQLDSILVSGFRESLAFNHLS